MAVPPLKNFPEEKVPRGLQVPSKTSWSSLLPWVHSEAFPANIHSQFPLETPIQPRTYTAWAATRSWSQPVNANPALGACQGCCWAPPRSPRASLLRLSMFLSLGSKRGGCGHRAGAPTPVTAAAPLSRAIVCETDWLPCCSQCFGTSMPEDIRALAPLRGPRRSRPVCSRALWGEGAGAWHSSGRAKPGVDRDGTRSRSVGQLRAAEKHWQWWWQKRSRGASVDAARQTLNNHC